MARSTYVVTYDISDDRRRDKVFRILHGFGDHTQYSVFLCELNEQELARLRTRVRPHIDHREDQLLIVEIGRATRLAAANIEAIGKPYDPPVRSIVI
jgi:CRISPR-associated protein Cas2